MYGLPPVKPSQYMDYSEDMPEICFVLVNGLTESLSGSEEDPPPIRLLKRRFPESHYHCFDTFPPWDYFPTRNDILEERGEALLRMLVQCHKCSTTSQGTFQGTKGFASIKGPIVFIGHDIGGSVIKRALVLANENWPSWRISETTLAIFFFGGLHRSSELHSWEKQLMSLVSKSQMGIETIFPLLPSLATAQATTAQRFLPIAASYTIFNVFEDSNFAVIPRFSATLNSLAENFGVQCGHKDLLPQEESASTLNWISGKIESLRNETSSTTKEYLKFLQQLMSMGLVANQQERLDSSPRLLDCINELQSYNKWLSAAGFSLLHIYGPPGSGVAVFTSNVILLYSHNTSEVDTCYLDFSFHRQHMWLSSEQNMICSLVHQLLLQQAALFQHMQPLCSWIMKERCTNLVNLWTLFKSLLSHMGKAKVLLTIRGVQGDDVAGRVADIITRVSRYCGVGLGLKVIITSELSDWNGATAGNIYQIQVKRVRALSHVLKELVHTRVQRLLATRPAWRSFDKTVTNICWGEEGDYDWAMARVQDIEIKSAAVLSTKAAFNHHLKSMPKDNWDFFQWVFRGISPKDVTWLKDALRWVVFSLRPLTSRELAVAVAFSQYNEYGSMIENSVEEFEASILSDLPGDINRIVGYFVKVNCGMVETTNNVVKSFLVRTYMRDAHKEHAEISGKCLKYMSWAVKVRNMEPTKSPKVDIGVRPAYDLLEYAVHHWSFHYRMAGDQDIHIAQLAEAFLGDSRNVELLSGVLSSNSPLYVNPNIWSSLLSIYATFGLDTLVMGYISRAEKLNLDLSSLSIVDAMKLAIERNHSEVALRLYRILLRDSEILPPLHAAAAMGNLGFLEQYVQVDVVKQSINDKDSEGYTPLFYAAQHGQGEAVNFLLKNGAEPNLINYEKWTALHVASRIGSLDIARLLIDQQADYNLQNGDGFNALDLAAEGGFDDLVVFLHPMYAEGNIERAANERSSTPLHLAAMYGHESTCVLLIQYGAQINVVDQENRTPVYVAVEGGFTTTVKALLTSKSIYPDVPRDGSTSRQEPGSLPFSSHSNLYENESILSPLQLAAEKGYTQIIDIILQYVRSETRFTYDLNQSLSRASAAGQWKSIEILLPYAVALNSIDANGDTALHVACKNDQNEVIEKLLQSKSYTADFRNKAGLSCLHVGAEAGHAAVVKTLIDWKWTDINIETSDGDKAIHIAAKAGHLSVVTALQRYKDMSTEKNKGGKTPLLLAATAGHISMVKEWLSMMGKPLLSSEAIWGESFPLHKAVSIGWEELASILIESGFDVNSLNQNMVAPLHLAAGLPSESMAILLIRNHANPLLLNSDGETALMIAAKRGREKTCRAIVEMFAERTVDFVNLQNLKSKSALFSACESGYTDVVHLLLKHGADPNQQCQEGWTPFHELASRGRTDLMHILLDSGAKYDVTNAQSLTPIMIAADAGHTEAVRLLLGIGASAVDPTGSSALHRAAQNGHFECVKLLVTDGRVDVNIKKRNGVTPLHLAILGNWDDVVQLLIEAGANVNTMMKEKFHVLDLAMWNFSSPFPMDKRARILKQLIYAGAIMKLGPDVSKFSPDLLVIALKNSRAFPMSSPGRVLQSVLVSRNWTAASILVESNLDVNETGGKYHTALQAAAAADSLYFVEKLLQKGANPNLTGGRYTSALNAAVVREHEIIVRLLLEKKAKTDVEYDGLLPLQRAIKQGSLDIVQRILDMGGDSTVKDRNGRSILAYAIHRGYKRVIDYLLTRDDVSIDEPDLRQQTPLMAAVLFENPDLVKKILDKKADPNVRDSEKKTPLIRAVEASQPNEEIIKALLASGADPRLRDCRDRGALYWACLGAKIKIIENMILPALRGQGDGNLKGELAFHAVASINSSSAQVAPLGVFQAHILFLLTEPWAREDPLGEDVNGWTPIYTATRFGNNSIAEGFERYLILFNSSGSLEYGNPKKPTGWHRDDKSPCLEVDEIGTSAILSSEPLKPNDLGTKHATIRSNHPMPGDKPYYFEVTIEEDADEKIIGIGFCEEHVSLDRMVGWDPGSWGYHGDDGKIVGANHAGFKFGTTYRKGDTVGCGVNFDKETAFFTKNGELIGPAFSGIRGKLYPAISIRTGTLKGRIRANFGCQKGFEFRYKDWESENNTIAEEPKEIENIERLFSGGGRSQDDRNSDLDSDLQWM